MSAPLVTIAAMAHDADVFAEVVAVVNRLELLGVEALRPLQRLPVLWLLCLPPQPNATKRAKEPVSGW